MKRRLSWDTKSRAYFVKDPEVVDTSLPIMPIKNEPIRDESPDITERRLKYKIDRGEYYFADAIYARKVWNLMNEINPKVQPEVRKRWYEEILVVFEEKAAILFAEKYKLREIFRVLPETERCQRCKYLNEYLMRDIKKRALTEPLKSLPIFLQRLKSGEKT